MSVENLHHVKDRSVHARRTPSKLQATQTFRKKPSLGRQGRLSHARDPKTKSRIKSLLQLTFFTNVPNNATSSSTATSAVNETFFTLTTKTSPDGSVLFFFFKKGQKIFDGGVHRIETGVIRFRNRELITTTQTEDDV